MQKRAELKNATLLSNSTTYTMYFDMIYEMAVSMWKYEGLPEEIDPIYMEQLLFYRGQVALFKDPVIGYLVLPFIPIGDLDNRGLPRSIRVYSISSSDLFDITLSNADAVTKAKYTAEIPTEEAVLIYNNASRTPASFTCTQFATRLMNIKRIQDVNLNAQKMATLLKCPEPKLRTILEVYKKVDSNEPAVFADDQFDEDSYTVLRTEAPYLYDRLATAESQEWQNVLTYLGISNANFAKRERMLTSEVTMAQGSVQASRNSRLGMREQAWESAKKVFGIEVTVSVKDAPKSIDEAMSGDEIKLTEGGGMTGVSE